MFQAPLPACRTHLTSLRDVKAPPFWRQPQLAAPHKWKQVFRLLLSGLSSGRIPQSLFGLFPIRLGIYI